MGQKSEGGSTKTNPWDLDLRVRERNLTNGVLDAKTVDKHLAELPDLEAQCDIVTERQPAVGDDDFDDDDAED